MKLFLILSFLIQSAFAGFPQGNHEKLYKDAFQFKNVIRTVTAGALDPSAVATPGEPGDLYFGSNNVYLKTDSGTTTNWDVLVDAAGGLVDLTSQVTGVLPIANGGTNSSTALVNDRLMRSETGAIVESGVTIDASNNISTSGEYTVFAGTSKEFEIGNEVLETLSTGVTSPNGITINGGDNTKYDIAATSGHIVDRVLDTYVSISYAGSTGNTPATANGVTYVFLDNLGAISTQTTIPTGEDLREKIYLGRVVTVGGVVVQTQDEPVVVENTASSIYDLAKALRVFNESGNLFTANGANLNLNKSAGKLFSAGANYITNRNEPHRVSLSACTTCTFAYITQLAGSTGADTTLVDPANYDNAGTITAVGGAAKTATIQRVYLFPSGNIRIAYGQNTYVDISDALQNLGQDVFVSNPNIEGNGVLMALIVSRRDATDLSDPDQARILYTSRFGESAVGAAGQSVSSLQDAYDNSNDGEITVDATRTSVEIRDASTPIASPLFEVLSNDSLTNYFSVNADKVESSLNLLLNGTGAIKVPAGTTAQRPGTPASGMFRFNSDTVQFEGYNGTAWGEIGGGAGGGFDYIENGDAEINTAGWTVYSNENVLPYPDTFSGNLDVHITWNRSTSFVRVGSASFELDKADGEDAQGNGVYYEFTAENGHRTLKHLLSMLADTSDVSIADGDLSLWLVGSDDNFSSDFLLISANNPDIKAGAPEIFKQFQFNSTKDKYRLCIHVSTSKLDGYAAYFDEIELGPRAVAKGFSGSDPVVEQATVNNFTLGNGTAQIAYAKMGKFLEADVYIQLGSTSSITGNLSIDLPSGLSIDTAALSSGLATEIRVYKGSIVDTGAAAYDVHLDYNDSNTLGLYVKTAGGTYVSDSAVNATTPITFSTSDKISLHFKVPIQGWSSETNISEDLGGRDIVVEGANNAGTVIVADTTPIDFTETKDTAGAWNGTVFEALETGDYDIEGNVYFTGAADRVILLFLDTGSGYSFKKTLSPRTTTDIHKLSETIFLNKGDKIQVRSSVNGGTLRNTSDALHHIYISKRSSGQTMLETAEVSARYTSNAGQSIPNATFTTIVYEDLDYNNGGISYDTTTGVGTIGVAGRYLVKGAARLSGAQVIGVRINVNSGATIYDLSVIGDTTTSQTGKSIDQINFNKGDTFEIQVSQSSGGPLSLGTDPAVVNFFISRIK